MKFNLAIRRAIKELHSLHPRFPRGTIQLRVSLAASTWNFSEWGADSFVQFCKEHFLADRQQRLELLEALDRALGEVSGHLEMTSKILSRGIDCDEVPLRPHHSLLAAFTPSAHFSEDLRNHKVAALVQLNFGTNETSPCQTKMGWVERRLADTGREMVPARLLAESTKTHSEAELYLRSFNLYLQNIRFHDSAVKFEKLPPLISHWGLRDHLISLYGAKGGLQKQRAIRGLLQNVVDGEIPRQIVNNPGAIWDQPRGTVKIGGRTVKADPTQCDRWEKFRRCFEVQKKIDPYLKFPSLLEHRFKVGHEMPLERVEAMLRTALGSAVAGPCAALLQKMIGRPLEAHDIYFKSFDTAGSKPPLTYNLAKRYPNASALTQAVPSVLRRLGFSAERATWIGSKIVVESSRAAGHAMGPSIREDIQRIRTRFPKEGADEQTFDTFMHELGHAVEQVLSSFPVSHYALWGIPAISFTEAFAFTFQERTDFILGRKVSAGVKAQNVQAIREFWELFHIAGPALVEIELFKWLYKHPGASAEQIQRKVRGIGDDIWENYYARVLGQEGYGLCSVYSHMLNCGLYLPFYPMGHIIGFQIRQFLHGKNLSKEMERLCAIGRVYPDVWMKEAVGTEVSVEPLLKAATKALAAAGR